MFMVKAEKGFVSQTAMFILLLKFPLHPLTYRLGKLQKLKSRGMRSTAMFLLVIPGRFELPTLRLGGECSIQLSYGTEYQLIKFITVLSSGQL